MEKAIVYMSYIKDHEEPKIKQPLDNNQFEKNVQDQWYVDFITYDSEQDERCYELMMVGSMIQV